MAANHQVGFLYPELHPMVAYYLAMDNTHFTFHPHDDDNYLRSYDIYVTGTVHCMNAQCALTEGPPAGGPNLIFAKVRIYADRRYNAKVHHIICRNCGIAIRPLLDGTYAERVASSLKWWLAVDIGPEMPAWPAPEPARSSIRRNHRREVPSNPAYAGRGPMGPVPEREMQRPPALMLPTWRERLIPTRQAESTQQLPAVYSGPDPGPLAPTGGELQEHQPDGSDE